MEMRTPCDAAAGERHAVRGMCAVHTCGGTIVCGMAIVRGRAMRQYTCMAAPHTRQAAHPHTAHTAHNTKVTMPSNAVAATIVQARKMAANPATAKVPVSLASIATAAGYPGSKASSVRQLARANGNGANANGQSRYAHNTPAAWVALLSGAQVALAPNAPKPAVAKATSASTRNAWLGKAAAQGGKQATTPRTPAPASTPQPVPANN